SVLNVFLLGLVQRLRERAVLRAIGTTTRREQAVVIAQGLVLAVLAAGFAVLGGLGLIYLQALASPVFYGFQLSWGVTAYPLVVGTLGVAALVAAAIAYPVLQASRLETSEVLQSD
ncbi:MAG: FtsX-like permease family protein, partial [[Mycobacterium] stephanolepidis]